MAPGPTSWAGRRSRPTADSRAQYGSTRKCWPTASIGALDVVGGKAAAVVSNNRPRKAWSIPGLLMIARTAPRNRTNYHEQR